MKTFPLTISSPEGNLFQGEARMLVLRTPVGELAVLAGHIPLLATVIPCKCKIELPDGKVRRAALEDGLLTVGKQAVTLLSGSFRFEAEGREPS